MLQYGTSYGPFHPPRCVELFSAGTADAHTERVIGFDEAKTEAMEALKMAVKERESLIVHIESDESDEGKDEPPPTPTSGKKRQHSLESEEDGDSDTLESKVCGCGCVCMYVWVWVWLMHGFLPLCTAGLWVCVRDTTAKEE